MKRFIATLALLAGLTHAAPITMHTVPDDTVLYDSSDPFAIGVSTAAYILGTNANTRIDAIMLSQGISADTATNIAVFVTARDAVAKSATNGWETGAHSDWLVRYAYDYTYTTNAGEVTITGYTGSDTYLTIPSFINGMPVTRLGTNAFNPATFSGVYIPEGVRSIDDGCFDNASFSSIEIPSTVTNLGANALLSMTALRAVIFKGNAPPNLLPYGLTGHYQTNYIASATATGWSATYGGRPVVRMAVYGDGTALTGIRTTRVYSPSSYNYWMDGDGVFWFYNVAFLTTSVVDRVTFASVFNASNDVWRAGIASSYPAANPSNYVSATDATNIAYSAIAGIATTTTLTPLYAVATGAVTTVEWSATPRINYIELATPTTITNSLANIGNCTSNAEVEVWVNATSTNALAPVWDARLQWAQDVPDMTVTGLYKFAFSSACGTNILARQLYPHVESWTTPLMTVGASANTATYVFGPLSGIMGATGTNGYVFVTSPNPSSYWTAKINVSFSSAAAKAVILTFAPSHISYGYASENISYSWNNSEPASAIAGFTSPVFIFPPAPAVRAHNGFGWIVTRSTNEGTVNVRSVMLRKANELETAAYNAGWRP